MKFTQDKDKLVKNIVCTRSIERCETEFHSVQAMRFSMFCKHEESLLLKPKE